MVASAEESLPIYRVARVAELVRPRNTGQARASPQKRPAFKERATVRIPKIRINGKNVPISRNKADLHIDEWLRLAGDALRQKDAKRLCEAVNSMMELVPSSDGEEGYKGNFRLHPDMYWMMISNYLDELRKMKKKKGVWAMILRYMRQIRRFFQKPITLRKRQLARQGAA